jgi:hypothetical protein
MKGNVFFSLVFSPTSQFCDTESNAATPMSIRYLVNEIIALINIIR